MDRATFLRQPDVQDFVKWMGRHLPNLAIELRFARSRYVRETDKNVIGIQGAQQAYQWVDGWDEVSKKLRAFRKCLREAVLSNDAAEAYNVCEMILKWGGVLNSCSKEFLQDLKASGELPGYLLEVEALLRLDSDNRTSHITLKTIPVFNSGMTKIHAIFDESGSPILDGRVAGAAATLYHLCRSDVCLERAPAANHLLFAWDEGPGLQVRNPQVLGAQFLGTLRLSRRKPHEWAVRQLQLGWIIRHVLETHVEIFPRLPIEERCHRCEAGLFMMGYDLRSIAPKGWDIPEPAALAKKHKAQAERGKR